jgi:hypothetical protein
LTALCFFLETDTEYATRIPFDKYCVVKKQEQCIVVKVNLDEACLAKEVPPGNYRMCVNDTRTSRITVLSATVPSESFWKPRPVRCEKKSEVQAEATTDAADDDVDMSPLQVLVEAAIQAPRFNARVDDSSTSNVRLSVTGTPRPHDIMVNLVPPPTKEFRWRLEDASSSSSSPCDMEIDSGADSIVLDFAAELAGQRFCAVVSDRAGIVEASTPTRSFVVPRTNSTPVPVSPRQSISPAPSVFSSAPPSSAGVVFPSAMSALRRLRGPVF